jgi:hypothetical protein
VAQLSHYRWGWPCRVEHSDALSFFPTCRRARDRPVQTWSRPAWAAATMKLACPPGGGTGSLSGGNTPSRMSAMPIRLLNGPWAFYSNLLLQCSGVSGSSHLHRPTRIVDFDSRRSSGLELKYSPPCHGEVAGSNPIGDAAFGSGPQLGRGRAAQHDSMSSQDSPRARRVRR